MDKIDKYRSEMNEKHYPIYWKIEDNEIKITDLYSDNKTIKQDIDTKMSISWEDNSDNMIDVSEDVTDITPPDNKD